MYTSQPFFHQNPQIFNQQAHTMNLQQPIQQVLYSNKKLEHINCILPANDQQGGLYIGDTISTFKPELIAQNNIGAILCLNQEAAKNAHLTRARFDYKYIQIKDMQNYPIRLHFESANQFIDKNLKNKINVLVQCHAGVSRSVTIICAYLIKHKNKIPEQAIHMVKSKRQRAKPNAGFWKQIQQYWTDLNQVNSDKKQKIQQNLFETPSKYSVQNLNPEKQVKTSKQSKRQLELSIQKPQKSVSLNKNFSQMLLKTQGKLKNKSGIDNAQQPQSYKKLRNSISNIQSSPQRSIKSTDYMPRQSEPLNNFQSIRPAMTNNLQQINHQMSNNYYQQQLRPAYYHHMGGNHAPVVYQHNGQFYQNGQLNGMYVNQNVQNYPQFPHYQYVVRPNIIN